MAEQNAATNQLIEGFDPTGKRREILEYIQNFGSLIRMGFLKEEEVDRVMSIIRDLDKYKDDPEKIAELKKALDKELLYNYSLTKLDGNFRESKENNTTYLSFKINNNKLVVETTYENQENSKIYKIFDEAKIIASGEDSNGNKFITIQTKSFIDANKKDGEYDPVTINMYLDENGNAILPSNDLYTKFGKPNAKLDKKYNDFAKEYVNDFEAMTSTGRKFKFPEWDPNKSLLSNIFSMLWNAISTLAQMVWEMVSGKKDKEAKEVEVKEKIPETKMTDARFNLYLKSLANNQVNISEAEFKQLINEYDRQKYDSKLNEFLSQKLSNNPDWVSGEKKLYNYFNSLEGEAQAIGFAILNKHPDISYDNFENIINKVFNSVSKNEIAKEALKDYKDKNLNEGLRVLLDVVNSHENKEAAIDYIRENLGVDMYKFIDFEKGTLKDVEGFSKYISENQEVKLKLKNIKDDSLKYAAVAGILGLSKDQSKFYSKDEINELFNKFADFETDNEAIKKQEQTKDKVVLISDVLSINKIDFNAFLSRENIDLSTASDDTIKQYFINYLTAKDLTSTLNTYQHALTTNDVTWIDKTKLDALKENSWKDCINADEIKKMFAMSKGQEVVIDTNSINKEIDDSIEKGDIKNVTKLPYDYIESQIDLCKQKIENAKKTIKEIDEYEKVNGTRNDGDDILYNDSMRVLRDEKEKMDYLVTLAQEQKKLNNSSFSDETFKKIDNNITSNNTPTTSGYSNTFVNASSLGILGKDLNDMSRGEFIKTINSKEYILNLPNGFSSVFNSGDNTIYSNALNGDKNSLLKANDSFVFKKELIEHLQNKAGIKLSQKEMQRFEKDYEYAINALKSPENLKKYTDIQLGTALSNADKRFDALLHTLLKNNPELYKDIMPELKNISYKFDEGVGDFLSKSNLTVEAKEAVLFMLNDLINNDKEAYNELLKKGFTKEKILESYGFYCMQLSTTQLSANVKFKSDFSGQYKYAFELCEEFKENNNINDDVEKLLFNFKKLEKANHSVSKDNVKLTPEIKAIFNKYLGDNTTSKYMNNSETISNTNLANLLKELDNLSVSNSDEKTLKDFGFILSNKEPKKEVETKENKKDEPKKEEPTKEKEQHSVGHQMNIK